MRRFAAAWTIVAWLGAMAPHGAWAASPELVRCESSARETVRCRADTSHGVTLQRQLSRAGCWYDETWGYDSRGIWVSNGCRADFALGRTAGLTPGDTSSASGASEGSGIDGKDVAIGAAAALALGAIAAAVIANRNDDDDDDRRYCRQRDRRGRCVDWDDGYSGGSRDPWRRDRIVRCESPKHRPAYCRVDTRRGVELYRKLSDAPCRYGTTWSYDRRGIYVDKGCRAEFLIRG
jgi:hypothetical protein